MKFRYKYKDKIVPIFILAAISMFFFFIVLITIKNRTFSSTYDYYTILDNASGLQNRPPILFKGIEIGRIRNFHLTKNNKTMVSFFVYKEYVKKMVPNSVIAVNTGTLSGDVTDLELLVPKYDPTQIKMAGKNNLIPYIRSEEGLAIVKSGHIPPPAEGISGITAKINAIMETFLENKTASKTDQSVKELNALLSTLNEILQKLSKTMDVPGPSGILGQVGGNSLSITLKNIEDSTNYIKETLSVVHKNRKSIAPLLINTNKTINKLNKTLKGVNNNPLIRGGITKDKKYIGVEVND